MDAPQNSDVVVLQTPRLLLRDFREEDAAQIAEYFSEPQARPHVLRSQRGFEQMSRWVEDAARYARAVPLPSRTDLLLAVALRDTRELIGMCTLSHVAAESRCAYIGWHLSNRFAGFGYATEVGRELIRFAFEERKVAQVSADFFESNAANLRVVVKLGMRPSRWVFLLKWWYALDYLELKPIVRYSIAADAYRAATAAPDARSC